MRKITDYKIGEHVMVKTTGKMTIVATIYYSKMQPPIWCEDGNGYNPDDLLKDAGPSGIPPLPPPTNKDAPAIVGQRIIGLRELTDAELEEEGWSRGFGDGPATVLELDNGSVLYPVRDGEGNGPGVLVQRKKDKTWYIMPPLKPKGTKG